MANHKSALKRIRKSETRRIHNRYYAKTMRSAVKSMRMITNKEEAIAKLPAVISMIDKVAKKEIIHKNKAANLKSKLTRKVNKLV